MGKNDKAQPPAAAQEKQDEGADGPTLNFVSKRLRNVRKKLGNIEKIEMAQKEGKYINSEQEAALGNKTVLKALEEELSKVLDGLKPIVEEERALAVSRSSPAAEAQAAPPSTPAPSVPAGPTPDIGVIVDAAVQDKLRRFLNLVYYSKLFDAAAVDPHTTALEKRACLSWDEYKDEGQGDILSEQDLDAVAGFGRLLTARQPEEARSHNDAVADRLDRVLSFLNESSSQAVPEIGGITYTRLRDRLDRIVAGEYVQQTPELVPLDAAAAGGVGANGNNAPAWAAASGGGAGGQGW